MRNIVLAGAMLASLAGCSMWHHDRDNNMQGSGTSTAPVSQSQTPPVSGNDTASAATDWSKCEEHVYTPGPRTCK